MEYVIVPDGGTLSGRPSRPMAGLRLSGYLEVSGLALWLTTRSPE